MPVLYVFRICIVSSAIQIILQVQINHTRISILFSLSVWISKTWILIKSKIEDQFYLSKINNQN